MKYILTIMLLLLAASAGAVTLVDTVKYSIDDVQVTTYGADTLMNRTAGYYALGNNGPELASGGFRFRGFRVPHGATIDSAFPSFYAYFNAATDTCRLNCYFEDTASADTFFTTGPNFFARNRTAAVAWLPDDWSGDTRYRGPDLKTILQHVIDRADYDSLNSIVLFVQNNASSFEAKRVVQSYDGGIGGAVILTVYYTAGGSAPADTANSLYRKASTRKGTYR
jgi:hypothetical protein